MLSSYKDKKLLIIFYLGFSSGLPLLLTLSTMAAWLKESGISLQSIGLFALVGLPYSLKFLWAPVKDALTIPILHKRLGHRLSWLLVTQIILAIAIGAMGQLDPQTQLGWIAIAALLIAFFSASQDIVGDAYRIELQQQAHLMGAVAAVHSLGYRVGMILASAGALYMASFYSWQFVYNVMACMMLICAVICWFCPKSSQDLVRETAKKLDLRESVILPIVDFMGRQNWIAIASFILLYKLGDALATSLATPFYLEMGFTKIEIANITKIFGPIAFLVGGFWGGDWVRRHGLMSGLWIGGIAQLLSNFMFAIQAVVGHDLWMLTATIGAENIASGFGSAAFVAYLSSLCNIRYTAAQYAILSSLMAVGRTVLSAGSGFAVASVGWVWFFIGTALAGLPGLVLLYWLMQKVRIANQTIH